MASGAKLFQTGPVPVPQTAGTRMLPRCGRAPRNGAGTAPKSRRLATDPAPGGAHLCVDASRGSHPPRYWSTSRSSSALQSCSAPPVSTTTLGAAAAGLCRPRMHTTSHACLPCVRLSVPGRTSVAPRPVDIGAVGSDPSGSLGKWSCCLPETFFTACTAAVQRRACCTVVPRQWRHAGTCLLPCTLSFLPWTTCERWGLQICSSLF